MANFNKVILIGNLTRDVELRYTPKGTAVAKIGLAINREWKDESGQKKEETTFVDVDAFGKQAEVVAQYVKKGRPLMVEGRLKMDSWDDKATGQKRSRLGVVLDSFQFMDSGGARDGASAPRPTATPARPAPASAPQPAATPVAELPAGSDYEDDVPFRSMPPSTLQARFLGFTGNKFR